MAVLTLRAPAKLNLFLHILGRRDDGYHDLESLVAFTELADGLRVESADGLSLTVEGEFAAEAGGAEQNLVMRAARVLASQADRPVGAALTLTKHLPVGAGLGGGSADAAAALRGLNRLWNLNLSKQDLAEIAVTLGADVAMCLDSAPAIARGIGERLTPLLKPLPEMGVLLVHPRVKLLTKDVYGAFSLKYASMPWTGELAQEDFLSMLKGTRNDLQRAAITAKAEVAEVLLALETLQPAPELVRMTGSGACCFALYSTQAMAEKGAQWLTRNHPEWWVIATRFRIVE